MVTSTPIDGLAPNASGEGASSGHRTGRRDIAICILLGIASFLIYNANLRSVPAGDTYGARYLPFSIWRNHSVVLDPIATIVSQGRKAPTSQGKTDTAYWVAVGRGDHLVSLYPIVLPVVITPLYMPAISYLNEVNWDPLQLDRVARIMEKLCASLIAAASVMLFYLLLRRRSQPKTAALLTIVYAFGTTTWVISSQALWLHGLAQLLIVATLFLLTGPCTAPRAAAAGLICALIACNRQPDAILAAGLGIYGLVWAGRRAWYFVAAGALPIGLVLVYNLRVVGQVAGAYGLIPSPGFFDHNIIEGVAGLLFSPTRGLFVFSPFLLFVPCFLLLVLRDRRTWLLTVLIGSAVLLQLAFYGIADWRQGISWGPRWQTGMVPILVWMLPPVLDELRGVGRLAFWVASAMAIAIEAIGAFWYIGVADPAVMAGQGPDKMRAAWDIKNAPFIAELKHRPAPADLAVHLRGNIDLITVADKQDGKAGPQVEVTGWALTNSRSPADVAVTVDGRITAGTSHFVERPDVARTLGETNPSGWRLEFPADDLTPGDHVLAALVRAHEGGETRLLKEQNFRLTSEGEAVRRDPELASAARRAADLLVERLQGPGYWLTSFTNEARFEQPRQELNTFLNAVMIDVADPVSQPADLTDALQRAREFLKNQIEPNGLVRYHGRPDAPTIGTLGCAITPDSDDTALAWRVAPGERTELLREALATLYRFRTADGLYRTWLAPQDRYECIDPGKDPNPADIAIQIHVLMLLAQADPPAAQALCDALQKRSADEDIWVYYDRAPALVILRLTDLRKAGCPLDLPERRLHTTVPGQEIWIEAVQLLQRLDSDSAEVRAAAYNESPELLSKLAGDDFSSLSVTPPLLFHNDLSASVNRFYWSEEFGYALWLRLYHETARAQSSPSCSQSAEQEC